MLKTQDSDADLYGDYGYSNQRCLSSEDGIKGSIPFISTTSLRSKAAMLLPLKETQVGSTPTEGTDWVGMQMVKQAVCKTVT
jgi:hypothetical protein